MKQKTAVLSFCLVAVLAFAAVYSLDWLKGQSGQRPVLVKEALATDLPKASPVKAIPEREVYYPGSEDLAPDEMRVTACGTGMPNARPKQAAACWLVELGNGDKFLFDMGTGAAERLAALQIPYDYLNKVFLGHLHADHMGDLPALWVGGTINNRTVPLEIWGPTGSEPQYGTKYSIEGLKEFYNWDIATRRGAFVASGQELIVHVSLEMAGQGEHGREQSDDGDQDETDPAGERGGVSRRQGPRPGLEAPAHRRRRDVVVFRDVRFSGHSRIRGSISL